jgi:hypothetical protein
MFGAKTDFSYELVVAHCIALIPCFQLGFDFLVMVAMVKKQSAMMEREHE